jgi:Haem-NO-binding
MKGIVFNLLEEVIRKQYSEDVWDSLLDSAHLDGAYTSLGNYGDEELMKLVSAASQALQLPPSEIVRWFGFHALPLMAEKYPAFFKNHRSTRPFVLTLNHIIHPEVRKVYPGADVPEFDFDTSSDEHLLVGYHSPRRLCMFAQGLVEGAAVFFSEDVLFEHVLCMHRGDEKCLFRIAFKPKKT